MSGAIPKTTELARRSCQLDRLRHEQLAHAGLKQAREQERPCAPAGAARGTELPPQPPRPRRRALPRSSPRSASSASGYLPRPIRSPTLIAPNRNADTHARTIAVTRRGRYSTGPGAREPCVHSASWPPTPERRSPPSSPRTCSSGSFVTCGSTPSRTGSPTTYPSTAKQLDLLRLLADELRELGLEDVELDEHGYVIATLPAAGARAARRSGSSRTSTPRRDERARTSTRSGSGYDGGEILLGDRASVLRPDESRAGRAHRPRHRHLRRDDAARRGQQGRRRRDRGRRRVARRASRSPARARAQIAFNGRRGGRPRDRPLRPVEKFGADFAYTVDGRRRARSRARRSRRSRSGSRSAGRDPSRAARRASRQRDQARSAAWRACRRTRSRPRRPRGARDSCTRTGSPATHPRSSCADRPRPRRRKLERARRAPARVAEEVVAADPRRRSRSSRWDQYRNMREALGASRRSSTQPRGGGRRVGLEPRLDRDPRRHRRLAR